MFTAVLFILEDERGSGKEENNLTIQEMGN